MKALEYESAGMYRHVHCAGNKLQKVYWDLDFSKSFYSIAQRLFIALKEKYLLRVVKN